MLGSAGGEVAVQLSMDQVHAGLVLIGELILLPEAVELVQELGVIAAELVHLVDDAHLMAHVEAVIVQLVLEQVVLLMTQHDHAGELQDEHELIRGESGEGRRLAEGDILPQVVGGRLIGLGLVSEDVLGQIGVADADDVLVPTLGAGQVAAEVIVLGFVAGTQLDSTDEGAVGADERVTEGIVENVGDILLADAEELGHGTLRVGLGIGSTPGGVAVHNRIDGAAVQLTDLALREGLSPGTIAGEAGDVLVSELSIDSHFVFLQTKICILATTLVYIL